MGNIVLFHRAYLSVQTRRCSCARGLPRQTPTRDIRNGKRSRSNSVVSSCNSMSSSNVRLRLPASAATSQSGFNTASFPVSGHGVHSRRASEKDALRRTESPTLPLVTGDHEFNHPIGPHEASYLPRTSTAWHNLVVVRLTETSCDRGSWDVLESKIVGLRRKTRSSWKIKGGMTTRINMGSSHGLTAAALDRWELWTFDPSSTTLRSSPLSALNGSHPTEHNSRGSHCPEISRLPFTRVSPFFCLGSYGFGGFGNTVGVFNFSLCKSEHTRKI